mmetsp:Transcript_78824/g.219116  ORF Transcript_78824/g.219116 Transcript_78824/m.219116 type:complete len:271 (+) Transcript_78824:152-964(+)
MLCVELRQAGIEICVPAVLGHGRMVDIALLAERILVIRKHLDLRRLGYQRRRAANLVRGVTLLLGDGCETLNLVNFSPQHLLVDLEDSVFCQLRRDLNARQQRLKTIQCVLEHLFHAFPVREHSRTVSLRQRRQCIFRYVALGQQLCSHLCKACRNMALPCELAAQDVVWNLLAPRTEPRSQVARHRSHLPRDMEEAPRQFCKELVQGRRTEARAPIHIGCAVAVILKRTPLQKPQDGGPDRRQGRRREQRPAGGPPSAPTLSKDIQKAW